MVTIGFTATTAVYTSNLGRRRSTLPPCGGETEFQVNTYTPDNQENPKVATDAAGDYVVVWQSNGQDGSGYGIYAQLYNKSVRRPQGSEFQVNTYTSDNQENPSVAMDSAGDFVVAWGELRRGRQRL